MRLRTAALFAFFGTACFFALRLIGTFWSGLFLSLTVIRLTVILFVLSILSILSFFIYFYKDHIEPGQARLKSATGWAIFGYAALAFMYTRDFLNFFNFGFLSDILQSRLLENLVPLIPWVSSVLALVFFGVYYKEDSVEERMRLRKAKLYAAIGAALAVLLRTLVAVSYISTGAVRWVSDLKGTLLVIAAPLVILSFLATEYFFLSFHKGRDII